MASWTPRRPSQRGDPLGGTFSQTSREQTSISGRHRKQSGNAYRQSSGSQVHICTAVSHISLVVRGLQRPKYATGGWR